MKSSLLNLVVIALASVSLTGCDGAINAKAIQLANDMSVFRDNQSKKLDDINSKFDRSYKDSLDMLQQAKAQELRLDRDRDAQRIADQIVSDPNNSLRSTFRDNLAAVVLAERKRVVDADQSVEAARTKYSAAYQKTSLALGKLDTVISDLHLLGQSNDQLGKFYDFATALERVYRGLQQQEQKAVESAAGTKTPPTVGTQLDRINNRNRVEAKAAGEPG